MIRVQLDGGEWSGGTHSVVKYLSVPLVNGVETAVYRGIAAP